MGFAALFARRGLVALSLVVGALLFPSATWALDNGQIRLGADYDIFVLGGEDYRPCAKACDEDPRCKSWTFLKNLGQCRLKHSVAPPYPNACCVSDVKKLKPPTTVADEIKCADFAVATVDAHDANRANQCGYRGPLWSDNYREIYGRCLESSPKRRDAESVERTEALDDCRALAGRSRQLMCDHYARVSVEQQRSNVSNKCGLATEYWTDDVSRHGRFCNSASKGQITDIVLRRESQIRNCLGRGGGLVDATCQKYAETSVAQFRLGQQLKCGRGYSGNRYWHSVAEDHYQWCLEARVDDRQKWVRERERGLRKCEDDRRRGPKVILQF